MLDQLQVGQVGHWEFFGGHLDHSNEMQTHHPHDCHSIDGCEVRICTYTPVCPYPWFNQELQDISSMVVAVIICHRTGILFFSCLDYFQSDHYSRTPTGGILDLTAISGFLSIATYIRRPWLIQWPPCPYHQDMDSSTQISSNGKIFCTRCLLKFLMKSSTSLQWYCSDVISDGRLHG